MNEIEQFKQDIDLLEVRFGKENKAAIDTAMNVYIKNDSRVPVYRQIMKESHIRTFGTVVNKSAAHKQDSQTPPDGVTFINDSAFKNNKFTNIVIPSSVKETGEAVFSYCALTSVIFGGGIETISRRVFTNNKITEVVPKLTGVWNNLSF